MSWHSDCRTTCSLVNMPLVLVLVFLLPCKSYTAQALSSGCVTVSGPKQNVSCVLPFKHNEILHTRCPQDPDDLGKHWCSTKVTKDLNHVMGQGEYGHCGPNCPLEPTTQGCDNQEKCWPVSACALRYSHKIAQSKICVLPDNQGIGLCCSDLRSSDINRVFPVSIELSIREVDENFISQGNTLRVVEVGSNFYQSQIEAIPKETLSNLTGAFVQWHLHKPKPGVANLHRLGVIAMEAARQLEKDGMIDSGTDEVRGADISESVLEDCYKTPQCNSEEPYRNMDGSCNNLKTPLFGKSLTPFQRVLNPIFEDHFNQPRLTVSGFPLESPRKISSTILSLEQDLSDQVSLMFMAFSKFVDHDLTHAPIQEGEQGQGIDCCVEGTMQTANTFCLPVEIPPSDRFFNRNCMHYVRSATAPNLACAPGKSEQVNQVTHWLDLSQLYGSNDDEAMGLRLMVGGRLKTVRSQSSGELPLPNMSTPICKGQLPCFFTGDSRVNELPYLAVLYTLFLREHNRVAKILQGFNPNWNDETLYQEAKRVVTAEWQHIIYNEFLPLLLGSNYMQVLQLWPLTKGLSQDYRDDFDPRITNEFASTAFRVSHSMIPEWVNLYSSDGQKSSSIRLREVFQNVDLIHTGSLDDLIRGLAYDPVGIVDHKFSQDIINHLFDGPISSLDLIALSIQQGRDHGIPSYNEFRRVCKVGKARSFEDLYGTVSQENIDRLKTVYQSVDDIDLYIGMYMEEPGFNGAFVGPTFLCLIGDQFARLKKGDRFFYDLGNQTGSFQKAQIDEIRKTSMARIICDNGDDIRSIQPLAFGLPSNPFNEETSCANTWSIPKVIFSPWREEIGGARSSIRSGGNGR